MLSSTDCWIGIKILRQNWRDFAWVSIDHQWTLFNLLRLFFLFIVIPLNTSLDGTPNFFYTYINFSRHQCCCFTIAPLFVLDKSMAWSRCLQDPCLKNLCKNAQASKNSHSNAQHLPFGFANTFMMSSLHALCTPRLPIPLYWLSWIAVSTVIVSFVCLKKQWVS